MKPEGQPRGRLDFCWRRMRATFDASRRNLIVAEKALADARFPRRPRVLFGFSIVRISGTEFI